MPPSRSSGGNTSLSWEIWLWGLATNHCCDCSRGTYQSWHHNNDIFGLGTSEPPWVGIRSGPRRKLLNSLRRHLLFGCLIKPPNRAGRKCRASPTKKLRRIHAVGTRNRRDVRARNERLLQDQSLILIRPKLRLSPLPHGFSRQNLERPALIHIFTHRIPPHDSCGK